MEREQLARAQGLFNVVSGAWALVHRRSFEVVFGAKADWWLVQTVAGLLVGNGLVQLGSARDEASLEQARRLGMATAATLLAVELRYGVSGRIRRTYLVDVPVEAGWIVLWLRSGRSPRQSRGASLMRSGTLRRAVTHAWPRRRLGRLADAGAL